MVQSRVRMHAAFERALASDIARVLNSVAVSAASRAGGGQSAASVAAAANALKAPLTRAIIARGTATARAFITLTGDQIGGGKKASNPAKVALDTTIEWLKVHAARRVTGINKTIKDSIRRALVRGEAAELTLPQLAKSIRELIGGTAARRRALVIARTETHTAANYGSQQAAEESGLSMVREWASAEDDRTRPSHAAANGQRRKMDKPFRVGGALLDFPGDPNGPPGEIINCRCVVLYAPKE
jgi:SPP1 gp7 family putative phage head morphogenesis protein